MPHKCVKCNTVYEDNTRAVIDGCDCGSKVFLFMRQSSGPIQDTGGKYSIDIDTLFKGELVRSEESIESSELGKYDINLDEVFGKKP